MKAAGGLLFNVVCLRIVAIASACVKKMEFVEGGAIQPSFWRKCMQSDDAMGVGG
jgi:hypothetical protein